MVSTARPACGRRVCPIRGDARVTPYGARGFRRRKVCHTRVQGLAFGGQLSKVSVSNVKSGEIGPYRRYSASTLVPEQLPAPLDSARNEIGQCATAYGGLFWTMPATKSDSLSSRLGWGLAGWLAGSGRRCLAGLGSQRGRGQRRCSPERGGLRRCGCSGRQSIRRNAPVSEVTFGTTAAGTGWQT